MTYWAKSRAQLRPCRITRLEKSASPGKVKSFEKANKVHCVHFSESAFTHFVELRREVLELLGESTEEFWDLGLDELKAKIALVSETGIRQMLHLRFQSTLNQAKLFSAESSRFSLYASVGSLDAANTAYREGTRDYGSCQERPRTARDYIHEQQIR